MTSSPGPAFARPMRTAAQREERRIRILGMLQAGHSYEAIARQERLSRERIRQIVAKSLETEKGATLPDQNRVQMARLEPALRLAASGIENGDFRAITQLLRVLERIDKYGSVVKAEVEDAVVLHARLMKKLNSIFEREDREKAAKAASEAAGGASTPLSEPAAAGVEEAKNLEIRESTVQAWLSL